VGRWPAAVEVQAPQPPGDSSSASAFEVRHERPADVFLVGVDLFGHQIVEEIVPGEALASAAR